MGTNIAHLFLPTAEPAKWGPTVIIIIIIILIIHRPKGSKAPGSQARCLLGWGTRGVGTLR